MTDAAPGRLVDWPHMDDFQVRRRGLFHWQVVCISADDGIERECAFGPAFGGADRRKGWRSRCAPP